MIYEIELEHDVDNRTYTYKAFVELTVVGEKPIKGSRFQPAEPGYAELVIGSVEKVYKYLPTIDSLQRCEAPEGFLNTLEEYIKGDDELLQHVIETEQEYHTDYK